MTADVQEAGALADHLICTILNFYGEEKYINNGEVFLALVNLLCFSMVERFESDSEIKDRFDQMFAICIPEQRAFAKTIPGRKPIFKVFEGGSLN